MEGLISEIYGIGRRQIDLRRWRNERISTDRGGTFSFSLGGRRGDRSIFSRSSSALANSLSSLAPVSFSFCQTKSAKVGFP